MPTILFPTDFSPGSQLALQQAVSLARDRHARLLVAHVVEPPVQLTEELAQAAHDKAIADLLASVAQVGQGATTSQGKSDGRPTEPPVEIEQRTLFGDPSTQIVNLAQDEQVDMIVMGASGRTGIKRLLMGSVAEAVTRRCNCPVLTLRSTDAIAAQLSGAPGAAATQAAAPFEPQQRHAPVSGEPAAGLKPEETTPALSLIWRAITARANDIHIDPQEDGFEVRFRIDGLLEHYCHLDRKIASALITQLKVQSELSIADPFHPQEGRLRLPASFRDIEARITTVPVVGGESISVRLFSRQLLLRPLDSLGLSAESAALVEKMLRQGEGLILVTGPTGSGKTTTMYSMLHALNNGKRNIVTIEDPVECSIPAFRQFSVDTRHDLSMTSGLRTLLRMDPDVLMVGEIRDPEAASVAMRAASSGKYVFSTFHTRDVASTVTALRDLQVDNRSLAGNLTGIISQRLRRRLCQECSAKRPITAEERAIFERQALTPPSELHIPVGCARCRGTGYIGRVGVFEVMIPNGQLIEAIKSGSSEDELRDRIRVAGTRSLLADALAKVSEGITSLDEVRALTWVDFAEPVNGDEQSA